MNHSAFSKTYKVNREQAAKGDLTILDRVEQESGRIKNKEMMHTLFKSSYTHGVDWQCSLRNWEHDNEYDGVIRLDESIENKSALNTMPNVSPERDSEYTLGLTSGRDYLS